MRPARSKDLSPIEESQELSLKAKMNYFMPSKIYETTFYFKLLIIYTQVI